MKRPILSILVLPFSLFLSHCVDIEQASIPSYQGPHESTHDIGVDRGRTDGSRGLSRTPSRHAGTYPSQEIAAFLQGYESGYNQAIRRSTGASYGQPLRVKKLQGRITIYEGSRALATCKTVAPNIESTRFINEQQQIVVKSRGNHGPATLQLFDSRDGAEKGRIMAFDVRNGQPSWAAGMGE